MSVAADEKTAFAGLEPVETRQLTYMSRTSMLRMTKFDCRCANFYQPESI
jgi:hypothetical protein